MGTKEEKEKKKSIEEAEERKRRKSGEKVNLFNDKWRQVVWRLKGGGAVFAGIAAAWLKLGRSRTWNKRGAPDVESKGTERRVMHDFHRLRSCSTVMAWVPRAASPWTIRAVYGLASHASARERGARGSRPTIGERSLKASWKSFFLLFFLKKRPPFYLRTAIALRLHLYLSILDIVPCNCDLSLRDLSFSSSVPWWKVTLSLYSWPFKVLFEMRARGNRSLNLYVTRDIFEIVEFH